MNHRQRHTLLEENIGLKKEHEELSAKIESLLSIIHDKMSAMEESIKRIEENGVLISPNLVQSDKKEQTIDRSPPPKPFIPTVDIKDIKVAVSDIKKKVGSVNLEDAARQLGELHNNP